MKRYGWLLLIAATVAVYANSLRGAFIYDDFNAIVDNPHVRRLWPVWEAASAPPQSTVAGRPVVSLTLALNYAVSGYGVWSYHLFNLALHIANALLLFGIVRRSLAGDRADEIALGVALVWAVHPLLTESVTYVVQRTELLMGLCLLLTLYCVIRNWRLGAVVACAFGMGCKEVMVVAPLIVLLYDRTFLAGTFRDTFRQPGKLYVALAATWIVFAVWGGTGPRSGTVGLRFAELTPWQYALTQCGVIGHYLRLSVWPQPLVMDYNDWPIARGWGDVWLAALAVGALMAGTVWALWRWPKLGFVGAWFFLILAPTSSVVPIVTEVAAERRMYLPLVAVVTLAVFGLSKMRARFAVVGLAVLLGVLTVRRNQDYRSEWAIWSDAVAKRPHNVRALVNLGTVLAKLGRMEEALARYKEALQVDPDNPDANFNFGVTLAGRGELDAALVHLKEAVRLVPRSVIARYNLALMLVRRGALTEAAAQLEEVLRLNPKYADAHYALGSVLAEQGRVDEAVRHWEETLHLDPRHEGARRALERVKG